MDTLEYTAEVCSETLMPALQDLEEVYLKAKDDPAFNKELDYYLKQFVGSRHLSFCGETY